MKQHLGFTLQFLVLLVAIPVIMFTEFSRGNKVEKPDNEPAQTDISFAKKTTGSMDTIFPSAHVWLN